MNWFVLVILALASYAKPWPQYRGNENLLEYLEMVCAYPKYTAMSLVLAEKPVLHSGPNKANHTRPLLAHLRKIHCPIDYIPTESVLSLQYILKSSKYRFRSIMAMFDFTAETMVEAHYEQHLSSLADLYGQCENCEPFLILFDANHHNLIEWTKRIFDGLPVNFRSILVATQSRPPEATLYIRPVLNGCYQYPGVFHPSHQREFNLLRSVDSSLCDLNTSTLNIGINNLMPNCRYVRIKDRFVFFYSVEVELIKVLESYFNFRSNWIDAKQDWGVKKGNQWTGAVGLLINKTADLAMCSISMTFARSRVIDYSNMVIHDQVGLISHSPQLKSRDWIIMDPFTWFVWIAIVISFLLISLALFCTIRGFGRPTPSQYNYQQILLRLYGIFLGQSLHYGNEARSTRLLYAVWILSTLVLSTSYSGAFYSILAVPEYEKSVDTAEDFIRVATDGRHTILIQQGTSYFDMFAKAEPNSGLLYIIGQHINRSEQKFSEGEHGIKILEVDRRFLLSMSKLALLFLRKTYSSKPLHLAKEGIANDIQSMAFPKRSPLKRPFSRALSRLLSTGLIDYWIQRTYFNMNGQTMSVYALFDNPNTRLSSNRQVLRLEDLTSVFILWGIGIAISIFAFLVELLNQRYIRRFLQRFQST